MPAPFSSTGPLPLPVGTARMRAGKVRDLYAWQDELWLVASDRLSAFDVVLRDPIPGKGQILTQLSRFWFEKTAALCPNHVLGWDPPPGVQWPVQWVGRTLRCRRARVIPLECVARGYLAGSGWKEYRDHGTVGGFVLPPRLSESDKLPTPIFTPATKAESGHDENLTEAQARAHVGDSLYDQLRDVTLRLYQFAADYAAERGILIADTKFEFGWAEDDPYQLLLIDEIFTPDSSRFWPADRYQPGGPQPSFDKQYVRDYLETLDWNKEPPGPRLPAEVIAGTQQKYQEALDRLTRTQP